MRRRVSLLAAATAAVVLYAAAAACGAQEKRYPVPTALEIEKMTAAAPRSAPAKPAKRRKMLLFSVTHGYRHTSIPFCAKAFEIMGAKTGAYETVLSDDLGNFEPEAIRQFDVICLNNTVGDLFMPGNVGKLPAAEKKAAVERGRRLRRSFMAWVRAGGGVVGVHAATASFTDWPEFGRMLGGYFNGHPWDETVTIKNDDPDHAVNAAFGGKGLRIKDEIYEFRAPYSREDLRVLVSLDVAHSKMDKAFKRTDGDFAVSWVRTWGKGRVFYCSLGHRHEIFWKEMVLAHFLAGIQFAAGDLKADTTPSAEIRKGTHPAREGMTPMFNGKDTTGWTCQPGGWVFEGDVLTHKSGGDIWTKAQYGDFVLDLELKLARDTNSGVLIRTGDTKRWVQTGIEIQIYDSYGKARPGKHDSGGIFDCLAPAVNAAAAPGYWNRMTITAKGASLRVVLNGKRVVDADLNKWTTPQKNPDGTANKFKTAYKDMPRRGRIGLQYHGHPIWFRNVRIKKLD